MSGSALILTGGHSHPGSQSAPSLSEIFGRLGYELEISEDPDTAFAGLVDGGPDLLIANTLRFSMTHERYAEHRDAWAFSLSHRARTAVTDWVHEGGRLLALHTALVSFDDWPGWGDLLGGSWDWERSSHPPVGEVHVRPVGNHPAAAPVEAFTVTDECYAGLDLRAGIDVVAEQSTCSEHGVADATTWHPAAWTHTVGAGRVAVSALGHDRRSLDHPVHRALLAELVRRLDDTGGSAPKRTPMTADLRRP